MVETFTQAQTRTVVYKKTLLLKKTRDGSLSLYSIHHVLSNVEDKQKQMV